jgi:hypothetical protein
MTYNRGQEATMQRTADTLNVRVGDSKHPITLTDSAVEAVQSEAAGKIIDALSNVWRIEETIKAGEGFTALALGELIELRDELQYATEMADVLAECRPLDEVNVTDSHE